MLSCNHIRNPLRLNVNVVSYIVRSDLFRPLSSAEAESTYRCLEQLLCSSFPYLQQTVSLSVSLIEVCANKPRANSTRVKWFLFNMAGHVTLNAPRRAS